MIPKTFKVAGGKTIHIDVVDTIESNSRKNSYLFGDFNDASNKIRVAKNVPVDGKDYFQTDEDMERTFLHELGHVFQFYSGVDMDEMEAQVFSNFMYEYLHTNKK